MQMQSELKNRDKSAPNDQLQLVMTEYLMRRDHHQSEIAELQEELEQKKENISALGQQNGELGFAGSRSGTIE